MFFLLIFIFGCAPSNPDDEVAIPDDILGKEKMIDILVDLQLVEGTLILKRSIGKAYLPYKEFYFNHVFEKHQVSREKFEESLDFYKDHLYLLNEIYGEVINKLKEMKKELDRQ